MLHMPLSSRQQWGKYHLTFDVTLLQYDDIAVNGRNTYKPQLLRLQRRPQLRVVLGLQRPRRTAFRDHDAISHKYITILQVSLQEVEEGFVYIHSLSFVLGF